MDVIADCISQSLCVAGEMFAKLQRAKEVLTDSDLRVKYDCWRRSGLLIPFDMWLSKQLSQVSS